MKRVQYLVRINKDPDSDWGASVPDLPGRVATAKTIDAALRWMEKAIQLHSRGMREDGVIPPLPRHRSVTPKRTSRQVDFYATIEVAPELAVVPGGGNFSSCWWRCCVCPSQLSAGSLGDFIVEAVTLL